MTVSVLGNDPSEAVFYPYGQRGNGQDDDGPAWKQAVSSSNLFRGTGVPRDLFNGQAILGAQLVREYLEFGDRHERGQVVQHEVSGDNCHSYSKPNRQGADESVGNDQEVA